VLAYAYGPLFLDHVLKVLTTPLALPASCRQLDYSQRKDLCTDLSCRLCLAARMVPFHPRTAVQILHLYEGLEALRSNADISPQAWQAFATAFRQLTDAWSPSWVDDALPPSVDCPGAAPRTAPHRKAGDSGLAEGGNAQPPLDPSPDDAAGPEPQCSKVPSRRPRQRQRRPVAA
jgi:hypothetical protein